MIVKRQKKQILHFFLQSWVLAFVVMLEGTISYGQPLIDNLPITNSTIESMVQDGNTLYIGGWFTYAGPNTGRGVLLNKSAGTYDPAFPIVNGTINVCVSDNQGGWYIGGSFTKVGTTYRNNLAHIKSDYTVDALWNPNPDNEVKTIALFESTVYVGGLFSNLGGVTRVRIGAIDATTGVTTNWDPDMDSVLVGGGITGVWGIAPTDTTIYFGGSFSKLKVNTIPVDRTNLAAVDADRGDPTDWNPGTVPAVGYLEYAVYGLKLADNDSTLFVYGNISSLGGVLRKGAGSVLTAVTSGYTTSWNPNLAKTFSTYGVVHTLALSGDTVYLGGDFNKIRTSTTLRNNIAAITRTGLGTVLAWNPNIKAPFYGASSHPNGVFSLILSEGVVYAGGNFTMVGSTARSNLAAIDRTTGLATDWNPHVADGDDQLVYTLQDGNSLFVGGSFISVNGEERKGLAAIDLQTKSVTSWNPTLDNIAPSQTFVKHLQQYESVLYVTGDFATASGQDRRNFAAISKTTGLPLDFLSTVSFVDVLPFVAVNQNKLYISGSFTTIGDSVRNRLACIDLTTGLVTEWNPHVSSITGYSSIQSMTFSGSTVFLGGNFDSVGYSPRQMLAEVDDSLGNVTPWDPNAGAISSAINLFAMQISGSTVYVGGQFDYIGLTPRTNLAAIDASTGVVTSWNPNCSFAGGSAGVYDLKISDNTLYVGAWSLNSIGGVPRPDVAAIDIPRATVTSWNPPLDFTAVSCLSLDHANKMVYWGGGYSTTAYDSLPNLAGYGDPSMQVTSTFPLTVSIGNEWNLVSIPGLHPIDQNINTWWSGRDINTPVYKFSNGYQSITTATPGEGYWLFHNGVNTYNTGDEWPSGGINIVPNDPITAASGWNLIGGYENVVATSGVTSTPSGLITGSFYQYIPNTGYQTATSLTPGYGYWVELTGAGSINIPSALDKATNTTVNKIKENWGKIIINDAAGKSYTLYSTNESSNLNSFNLPPLPPAGLFDVRFGSQRFVEDLYSSPNTIDLNGVTYPVTISVKDMDLNLEDAIDGSKVSTVIKDGNSFVLSNSSISTLKVSSIAVVPIEYSLEQNYPNPFNPATTIKFSLPEVSDVKLTIYNTIGQRVAVIVNSTMDAGSYSINWDASNVASGLYFYELSTKNFSSIKKMILLK